MAVHVHRMGWVTPLLLGLSLGLVAMLAGPGLAAPVDADLLLRGGTIHDGSGRGSIVGDVAIRAGRIVAVGQVTPGKVGRTIDCRGLVVAPGLIDLHTHSDGTLSAPDIRPCLNYVLQGCTTMVTGNCGGSRDTAKFLQDVDANGAGTNIMHLVGHGTVRGAVMHGERRAPTTAELERMKAIVTQAMRDGAWGMSTGLIYAPSSYAQTDELIALARVVAAHGGLYVSHIRSETEQVVEAVAEAIRIGRESGAPVHISHFKSMQIPNWGRIHDSVALIERARAQGLKVTADQYPYTANSFSLHDAALPDRELQGCPRSQINKRMAGDPQFAALVRRVIAEQLGRYERVAIAASKKFPDYVGRSLQEIASREKIGAVDLVLKIVAQESPEVVCHSMSEKDVRWAMTLPWVATASDGAARKQDPREHHHPRNFGTFARKIGFYAIQEKVLSLPQAIRSATGLPADIFGIPERGYLRAGFMADVMVFDPAAYRDQATFDKPQLFATGVRYVFLAGQAAVSEGKPSSKLYGRALRHRSTEPAPFAVRVEAEEAVCNPPAYEVTNNGSGMFWGSGSPQIARVGERLFVSAFEAVPGCAPLNNARWALYERGSEGWRFCQRDAKDRTREPCPLCVSHAGRLLMSANPTLAPWVAAPADMEKRKMSGGHGDVAHRWTGGPARPEFLEFATGRPAQPPRHLAPAWTDEPKFTEHSYRTFAADGASGEFILFQNIGSTHSQWAFLDKAGAWKTGQLVWPQGEDTRYSPYHDKRARVNYPNAILCNREVHFIGQSPFNIWKRIDPLKSETWGRDKWGARMRKLQYAWTPDITRTPFSAWTVVADTMDDGSTLFLGDSWRAPDGRVHLVWQQTPIHRGLRDKYFPDIKRDSRLWYGVLERGKVLEKRVLFAGGETTGPVQPTGQARFHITPDQTRYLLFNLIGTTAETRQETGSYAARFERDGSLSAPVRIPFERPLTGTFFTASPRAGNRLTEAADLLISDTVDGRPVARYARLRFCRPNE
jgi:N-acyl-D-aspartate/D-glutamate deacylase